jgi:phage tail-like protein
MALLLLNHDPEPNETNVPLDSHIAVDIADDSATGVDAAATQVFVDGVLAFDGGTFKPLFNGPFSGTSNPDPYTLRVQIDTTYEFESVVLVSVQVISDITGGGAAIDETYTFTTEDTRPPVVESVEPLTKKLIRVTFNEAVKNTDATSSDDALNPANYVFERTDEMPSYLPTGASVKKVSDQVYELTTDEELTFGRSYRLHVINVEDVWGNESEAPTNFGDFVAHTPPQPPRRRCQFWDFIPAKNKREDTTRDLEFFVAMLQDLFDVMLGELDDWLDIIDIDRASDTGFLDAILLDLGNPFTFDLTEIDKRRLGKLLVGIYKEKGTRSGIINAVRLFIRVGPDGTDPLEVTCDEYNLAQRWVLGESTLDGTDTTDAGPGDTWLGPGTVHLLKSYKVVSPVGLTADQRVRVTQIAEYMQPVYMHFKGITEPSTPATIDHIELGLSELGLNWTLH